MAFIPGEVINKSFKASLHIPLFCCMLINYSLINQTPIYGDDKEEEFKPKIINTVLTTKDGWLIPITYYQSKLREKSSVLIFLHGKNGNRLNWDSIIAPYFNNEGYTVITVDLRKHGKSRPIGTDLNDDRNQKLKSRDYKLMVAQDMEAVKEFIYIEHQQKYLNMRKTAIIATDMSAPVAIVFAFRDWNKLPHKDGPTLQTSTPRGQDIRALVLFSPDEKVPGVSTSMALKNLKDPYKNLAVLTIVGNKDLRDHGQAEKIYTKLDGKKNERKEGRFQLRIYKTKYRGNNLFSKNIPAMEQFINFLEEYLKPINDPWRDRESTYNK